MYLPIDFIWFKTDQLEKNKKWHKITLRGEGGVEDEGGAAGSRRGWVHGETIM